MANTSTINKSTMVAELELNHLDNKIYSAIKKLEDKKLRRY